LGIFFHQSNVAKQEVEKYILQLTVGKAQSSFLQRASKIKVIFFSSQYAGRQGIKNGPGGQPGPRDALRGALDESGLA
jgi:hypothetical protein